MYDTTSLALAVAALVAAAVHAFWIHGRWVDHDIAANAVERIARQRGLAYVLKLCTAAPKEMIFFRGVKESVLSAVRSAGSHPAEGSYRDKPSAPHEEVVRAVEETFAAHIEAAERDLGHRRWLAAVAFLLALLAIRPLPEGTVPLHWIALSAGGAVLLAGFSAWRSLRIPTVSRRVFAPIAAQIARSALDGPPEPSKAEPAKAPSTPPAALDRPEQWSEEHGVIYPFETDAARAFHDALSEVEGAKQARLALLRRVRESGHGLPPWLVVALGEPAVIGDIRARIARLREDAELAAPEGVSSTRPPGDTPAWREKARYFELRAAIAEGAYEQVRS